MKRWKKPVMITLKAAQLETHILAAARSYPEDQCSWGDFR